MCEHKPNTPALYTCAEYREEMILLALQRKVLQPDLGEEERTRMQQQITELTRKIGL